MQIIENLKENNKKKNNIWKNLENLHYTLSQLHI